MRNHHVVGLILAVMALILVVSIAYAQDELTLEGLAETVAGIVTHMHTMLDGIVDLEARVAALEGGPDAGFCSPSVKNYHPMTLAGIDNENPRYEVDPYPDISHVRLNTETGEIIVQWQSCCTEIVTEYYDKQCNWKGFELD